MSELVIELKHAAHSKQVADIAEETIKKYIPGIILLVRFSFF